MGKHFTNVVKTEPFSIGDAASAVRFDYFTLHDFHCPIVLFDHVRMRSAGFPPHPHAGFCVFSYILEDSKGALRDRDSLNTELIVEPGDLLWFQMASGMIHEENPVVDGAEVHQFQVFVNLSPEKQKLPPRTFLLKSGDVPVSVDAAGNRSRVVLGNHNGLASPLATTEPFTLLDMRLPAAGGVTVAKGWTGLLYALSGRVAAACGDETATVSAGEVLGIREDAAVRLTGGEDCHVLFVSRPILDQPVVMQGMYVMTNQADIDAAKRRYHAGDFGDVVPFARLTEPGKPYVPAGQDPDLSVTPTVLHQATARHYDDGWWKLHFQYCRFDYSDYETAHGYRFVWEDPDGREAPYREGGFIPYMEYVRELLDAAAREGWGDIPYRDSF